MLRRAAEISPPGSAQRLEAFYGLLTTFDEDPDLHASQLTACLDSLEDFPFDLQLLLALGNYMLVRERLDLAIRAFEAAVRFGRITPTVWHLCEVREIAAVCLGLALQARQRDDEACSVLETALAARPDSLRLLHQLYTLYRKLGKSAEALALAERLPSSLRTLARIGDRPGKTGSNCGSTPAGSRAIWRRTSPPSSRSPSAIDADARFARHDPAGRSPLASRREKSPRIFSRHG